MGLPDLRPLTRGSPIRLFGTDGIRGIPGRFPLMEPVLRRIGWAAAEVLGGPRRKNRRGLILLGRDTRRSGPAIQRILSEAFREAGLSGEDAGVLPTPALAALLGQTGRYRFGAVISASHNPARYNGIKFLGPGGEKISPAQEEKIERALWRALPPPFPGRRQRGGSAAFLRRTYLKFLQARFQPRLPERRIVVDSANGACVSTAPAALRPVCRTVWIGRRPNGRNINASCGSLHPERMRREVLRARAAAGFAFDGDGDRCIACDETGRLLDGDDLAWILSRFFRPKTVVLTVMSNSGLVEALRREGVRVRITPVGDRHVAEALKESGGGIGAETSGHLILWRFSRTGDGLLTALAVLTAMEKTGRPLSELRRGWSRHAQVLCGVAWNASDGKAAQERRDRLQRQAAAWKKRWDGAGRILIRPSGTEPVLRILAEHPEMAEARAAASSLMAAAR